MSSDDFRTFSFFKIEKFTFATFELRTKRASCRQVVSVCTHPCPNDFFIPLILIPSQFHTHFPSPILGIKRAEKAESARNVSMSIGSDHLEDGLWRQMSWTQSGIENGKMFEWNGVGSGETTGNGVNGWVGEPTICWYSSVSRYQLNGRGALKGKQKRGKSSLFGAERRLETGEHK